MDAIYPEDDADWSNWEYPKMTADDYITQNMLDELQETYPDEIAGFGISAYLGSGQIYKTVINMRMWTQQERQKKNWST